MRKARKDETEGVKYVSLSTSMNGSLLWSQIAYKIRFQFEGQIL